MRNKLFRHIRQSLSLKLSLGIVLLAIPIFVVSLGILFSQSRHIVRVEAMQRAGNVLNTTMLRVNGFMKTIETATNTTDWLIQEDLQPDSLFALSRRIVVLNSNVNGCSITTEPYLFPQYGRYFSAYTIREGDSVVTVREGEYNYFEKVWYKTPRDLGKACWVEPFDDYNEGTLYTTELIASYCKPLYDKDQQLLGVISTDLSLRQLASAISEEQAFPHSYFMLIGKDGHFFLHPDTSKLFKQTIFTNADPRRNADIIALGHEMTAGKKGHMQAHIDGNPCLVCYQQVPGTSWSLALVCPDSDILQSYHRLTNFLIPLVVLGLLFILLLCNRVVRHAVIPLHKLVRQSQQIATGNYNQQIPHSQRADEIGRLQNSFVAMQESLNVHLNSIQQANEEAKQRNEELAHASQLVEDATRQKTAFIQNVTHQIRTPLNIIMGFAQVLRDSIKMLPEEEAKNITDVMSHNTGTLSRMVLMLYDSSETGMTEALISNKNEEVSCNEVAREGIEHTYLHFPELHVEFHTELPDTFTIHTSNIYLMRSLREILYNSCKYSDGQHISLSILDGPTTVRFVFEDKGPGIPEDYREQMFEAFTKTDDLSEGLGLGLPLAKRHIEHLGGTLLLDTDYHEGCRFIIELPKK